MTGLPALGVLALLVCCHFLADFPLQGAFLAEQKDRHLPKGRRLVPWQWAMHAHCAVHALFVLLATGAWWLAALEWAAHWWTDTMKCDRQIRFGEDQAQHLYYKLLWFGLWYAFCRHHPP